MKQITLACIFISLLVACDRQQPSAVAVPSITKDSQKINYQIVAASNGGAWKVDTLSGVMTYCAAFSPAAEGPACFQAKE